MFVNDRVEIGTLEYRLSSNLYGMVLNRAKGLSSVRHVLKLLVSGREEVGGISRSHSLLLRTTPILGVFNEYSFQGGETLPFFKPNQ